MKAKPWWDDGTGDMEAPKEGRLCDGCIRPTCPQQCPLQPIDMP